MVRYDAVSHERRLRSLAPAPERRSLIARARPPSPSTPRARAGIAAGAICSTRQRGATKKATRGGEAPRSLSPPRVGRLRAELASGQDWSALHRSPRLQAL